jgi:PAS domain S-box-containing protein
MSKAEKEVLRLQSIIDCSNLGTWEWNIQTGETVFNETWAQIIGYTLEELAPTSIKTWEALSHPGDLNKSGELLERHFTAEQPHYEIECRMKHKDGHWVWVRDRGKVTSWTNDGKPLMMYGSHIDISKRKLIELALHDSEEKQNTILSNISDVIGIIGLDGIMKYKSPNIEKWFGWKPQDLVGTDGWLTIHPDDLGRIQKEFHIILEKENAVTTVEYRYKCKDGDYKWVELTATNLTHDPVIGGVLLNYHDITKRRLAEATIREKDIQFQTLSQTVPNLSYQFTRRPDGTYFVPIASEGIKNIFGCTPEDVINDFGPISRVLYPDDAAMVIRDIEYSTEHLTYFTCEFRVQIPGREIQWIYSRSSPEKLPDGSVTWYGFNMDITERKLGEKALQERDEDLKEVQRIAHVGSWRLDISTNEVTWSEELYKMYGFDPSLPPPPYNEHRRIFTPESWDRLSKALPETIETGKPYELELETVRPDGSNGWMWVHGEVLLDKIGVTVGLRGAAHDITERKRASAVLRESEEKYRLLYTAMDQGLALHEIIIDENGKPVDYVFLDINDSYIRLLGITREMSIGKSIKEIMPDVEQYWIDIFGKVALTGESSYYENYLETTGRYYSTYSYCPKKNYFAVLVNDITEHKLAEEAIAAEREQLAVTLRSIGDGVITTDTLGNVVIMNKVAEELCGWKQDEAQGKPLVSVFNIINQSTREQHENPVEKVLTTLHSRTHITI